MQGVDVKFQYQVSPQLAEQIAAEQLNLTLRSQGSVLPYLPFILAVLFALVGFSMSQHLKIIDVDYPLIGRLINTVLGLAFGFGIGFVIRRSIRSRFVGQARATSKKIGPARAVSWNSDGVNIKNSAFETKIGWWSIERIQIENAGVYGFFMGRISFVIPKTAFPPHATAESFVQTWQTQKKQPPPISSALNP